MATKRSSSSPNLELPSLASPPLTPLPELPLEAKAPTPAPTPRNASHLFGEYSWPSLDVATLTEKLEDVLETCQDHDESQDDHDVTIGVRHSHFCPRSASSSYLCVCSMIRRLSVMSSDEETSASETDCDGEVDNPLKETYVLGHVIESPVSSWGNDHRLAPFLTNADVTGASEDCRNDAETRKPTEPERNDDVPLDCHDAANDGLSDGISSAVPSLLTDSRHMDDHPPETGTDERETSYVKSSEAKETSLLDHDCVEQKQFSLGAIRPLKEVD
ncbi:MAG: hypothetical protein Q9201_002964 [Fulgogasparrea decipioides]